MSGELWLSIKMLFGKLSRSKNEKNRRPKSKCTTMSLKLREQCEKLKLREKKKQGKSMRDSSWKLRTLLQTTTTRSQTQKDKKKEMS